MPVDSKGETPVKDGRDGGKKNENKKGRRNKRKKIDNYSLEKDKHLKQHPTPRHQHQNEEKINKTKTDSITHLYTPPRPLLPEPIQPAEHITPNASPETGIVGRPCEK